MKKYKKKKSDKPADKTARVYRYKNARVKKELSFSTPKKTKLA